MSIFQYKKIIFIFLGLIFWIIGIISFVHYYNSNNFLFEKQLLSRSYWHTATGSVLFYPETNEAIRPRTQIESSNADELFEKLSQNHSWTQQCLKSVFFRVFLKPVGVGLAVDSLLNRIVLRTQKEDSLIHIYQSRTRMILREIKELEKQSRQLSLENRTRFRMAGIRLANEYGYFLKEFLSVNQLLVRDMTLLSQVIPAVTLRIYFYLVIFSLVFVFGAMILTLHFLINPLEELEIASRKIIRRDLQDAVYHIPYYGNNVYGRISLAMRKLVTYMSEIDTMKSNILAQVTHDLKSPLGTFQQGLELLEDDALGVLNEKQSEVVELMKSAQKTMHEMISKLLNTAKIEYDSYKIQFTGFDLIQLCRTVMDEYLQYLKNKNLKIMFNKNKRERLEIIADKKGMVDILRNVIGNAIKFTPEGGKIYLSVGMKNYEVHIQIRDTGIGIPREELDRIFEKLYRGKNSKQVSVKGTGLGLYLVKQIVNRHNGEIFVSSQIGKGTTFDIYLPRFQSYVDEIEEDE